MKAIVVGAGGTSRELLRRLGERWDVTLIDTDEGRLELAAELRAVDTLVGDGSSRLVLKRAGLEEADAVIAASNDDDANLEAVGHAMESGVMRIVAVAADPERLGDYRDLDITAFAPDSLVARNIETQLEPRRVASTTFADGKAEAIEFVISPDSPVRGKALRELHSESWVVAAVLRDGQLIVPHGYTRLEARDRVTVVGSAQDYATIVHVFTSGESRFPLNYGKNVLVAVSSVDDIAGPFAEAMSLVRNSEAETLVVAHRDPASTRDDSMIEEINSVIEAARDAAEGVELEFRPVDGAANQGLFEVPQSESIGVVVVPAPSGGDVAGRIRVARALNSLREIDRPVLFSRATHPYSSIVAPARRTAAGESAGRAAIDIAATTGATLAGVAVVPPSFVSGAGAIEDARRATAWLREEAAVQGITVRRKIRQGNPIRVIEELANAASLVVLPFPNNRSTVFRPAIAEHVLRRTRVSTLLVPQRD
ncbi:MAG: NAD-binding protein [Acidimicrobiia bacterium]|nr:NAD-binding protein [Acidimicrobiia bacterium]